MRRLTGSLLWIVPLLVAATSSVWAQTPPSRTITVTSSAEVRAVPDRAVVQLGVQTRASNAQAALTQNNDQIARVIAALKGLGIPDTDLQTSQLSVQPVYNSESPNQPPQLVGFEAMNIVSVQLADMARIGPVIDAAVTAGANQVMGIGFRVADEDRVQLTALRDAVMRSRPQAEAIAAAAGVTLGDVDAVMEVGRSAVPVGDAAAIGGGTPVLPGTVTLRVDVQVRYQIR
jgi:uncharacterized protein YggE